MSDFTSVTRSIIQLDYANAFIPDVRLNGGDENGRIICVQLLDNGVPVDDSTVEVFLCWNRQPGVLIGDSVKMEAKDSDNGRIWQVPVPVAACRMPGTVTLGFEVKRENTVVCSRSFTAIVERPVFDAGSSEGKSYRQELEDAAQGAVDATSKANALSDKFAHLVEQSEQVAKNAQAAVEAANQAAQKTESVCSAASGAASKASQAAQDAQSVISRANSAVEACDASKQAADQAAARADAAVSSMKQTVQDATNDAASKVQQAVERANSAAQQADSVREKTETANKQTETDLAALKEEVVKAQRSGFSASSSAQKCDEAAQAYRNVSGEVAQAKQTSEQAVEAANNALHTAQESATAVAQAQSVLDQVKTAGETAAKVVGAVEELKQTKEAALEATRTANAQAAAAGEAAGKANNATSTANGAAQAATEAAGKVTQALQESETRLKAVEQAAQDAKSVASTANSTSETARATAEQAQSKANDAANAAQRAQSTANSAVEATDNNKNKIASMDNTLTACRKGKYLNAGAGIEFTTQSNPMDGITISTTSYVCTYTVKANEFKGNVANIPIPNTLAGTHRVRIVSLKPKSQDEAKLYAEASPIFLDSDDDSSIGGNLRVIVKKPTDLKFTVLEQEVRR